MERSHEFNGRTTEMNYDMMGRLTYPACFRICEHEAIQHGQVQNYRNIFYSSSFALSTVN
jgi:hypothetical protein